MKSFVLLYGVISYLAGLVGMVSIIAAVVGFLPFGFLWQSDSDSSGAWLWNFLLMAIWGAIHTGTARPSYKKILSRVVPVVAERATYVLIAGITSVLLIGYWHEIPGVVWQVETGSVIFILWAIAIFGWVFLLASTFAINHFDLFGLRQVYLNFKNQTCPPLEFSERLMYKYVRHPIQTGVLIGVWAAPTMTMTHFSLSIGFTIYIFVGLWFEERDLITEHGESYNDYKRRVGGLFPKIWT